MPKIEWDDALSLGIQRIDDQHKQLIGYANRFLDAAKNAAAPHLVKETITKLREYTVYHFHDEEEYMADIRYPGRSEHQSEHQQLVQKIKNLQRDIYQGREVTAEKLLPILKDWLLNHILQSDLSIGSYVKSKQVAPPVAENSALQENKPPEN